MATKTLLASFDSRRRTTSAQTGLLRAGVESADIEVEQLTLKFRNLFKLRAVVEEAVSRRAVDVLWDAGALDIEQRPNRPGEELRRAEWIGRQQEA